MSKAWRSTPLLKVLGKVAAKSGYDLTDPPDYRCALRMLAWMNAGVLDPACATSTHSRYDTWERGRDRLTKLTQAEMSVKP